MHTTNANPTNNNSNGRLNDVLDGFERLCDRTGKTIKSDRFVGGFAIGAFVGAVIDAAISVSETLL